jgi:hypothetical protein
MVCANKWLYITKRSFNYYERIVLCSKTWETLRNYVKIILEDVHTEVKRNGSLSRLKFIYSLCPPCTTGYVKEFRTRGRQDICVGI